MATALALSAQNTIAELEQAARRFPDNKQIQFNLGLALVQKGQLRSAVAPLERAAQDPALANEAHFLLGADYFEDNKYELAIEELRGLENSEHAERVLYMLEESERRTGKVEEAKATFHNLITKYPDSPWTDYLMANAYEDQKEPEKAIEEYQAALKKDTAIPNANFAIGYIYFRQQDTENAKQWLQKETAKGCHGLANYYLGEIARGEKNLKQAESFYRRAIECDPTQGDAHLRLGTILGEQKRYPEALAELRQAVHLEPDQSSPHYHLGALYKLMGRTADAEAEYKKVREIQAATDTGVDVTRGPKP